MSGVITSCAVFRKCRCALAFENTVEDDYVTEKVYNAHAVGCAAPMFIGVMNIAEYVPRTSGSVPSHGLSVIPVLQMFPILSETAWRTEERRVLDLLEEDEAASRHILRTHAAVLRARSASAHCADERTGMTAKRSDGAVRMAETVAMALEEVCCADVACCRGPSPSSLPLQRCRRTSGADGRQQRVAAGRAARCRSLGQLQFRLWRRCAAVHVPDRGVAACVGASAPLPTRRGDDRGCRQERQ